MLSRGDAHNLWESGDENNAKRNSTQGRNRHNPQGRFALRIGVSSRSESNTNRLGSCFGEYRSNVGRYFDNYLGTPKLPVLFGGRQDVLDELDQWLASDVQYLLLAAPAGRGKSSVAVHWVMSLLDSQPHLKVIFLPISTRFSTSSSSVALSSLLARLRLFFPNIIISPSRSVDEFKSCFVNALETLRYDQHDQHNKFLLVFDGIDEPAADWVDQELLPLDPPKNLHVLLTARFTPDLPDEDAWFRRLGWIRKGWKTQDVFMSLPTEISRRASSPFEWWRTLVSEPLYPKLARRTRLPRVGCYERAALLGAGLPRIYGLLVIGSASSLARPAGKAVANRATRGNLRVTGNGDLSSSAW